MQVKNSVEKQWLIDHYPDKICPYESKHWKKDKRCRDLKCWDSQKFIHFRERPKTCWYQEKCHTFFCMYLHPWEQRLQQQNLKKKQTEAKKRYSAAGIQCPECQFKGKPLFGPARESTNSENRSGHYVSCCANCKYVYSSTF